MTTTTRILAGAMSGTSADGVDIALTQITGHGLSMSAKLLLHHHLPYPPSLRQTIFSLRSTGQTSLRTLAQLGQDISLAYAAAIHQSLHVAHLTPNDITAIAAHGQTLFHDAPLTIQYLDPSLLAHQTNIQVVSDFRRADLAAGGQGAPLVPFADYLLFRHPTKSRILLNLGGIANLTYLPPNCTPNQVLAFDTGPANCISDHLCQAHNLPYDPNGTHASQGTPLPHVIDKILASPYFTQPPPKSTDGPAMIQLFQSSLPPGNHPLNDLLATATLLTATSIHRAITSLNTPPINEIITSGGGIYNQSIMTHLHSLFPQTQIKQTQDLGLPPDAKEALAFALLAAATLDNIPSNLPSVTGAKRPVLLGSITPKP